jgi:hypothetical protein
MRTTGGAGLTHGAEPDGFRMEDHFLLTKLNRPHHLIGGEIEVLDHRTTCGALLTLVAEKDILSSLFSNGFGEIGV